MSDRKIFVFESDTHAGMNFGLMYPDVILLTTDIYGRDEEYSPKQRSIQKLLCEIRDENLRLAKEVAEGDEIIYVHNGDLCHGTKYPQFLVSTNIEDQLAIARRNVEEVFAILGNNTKMLLIEGTGAHDFGEGAAELNIYNRFKDTHRMSYGKHVLLPFGEWKADIAHHGAGVGIRTWTRGNQMRYYTRSIMEEDIIEGVEPPDLIVRGHFHTYQSEFINVGLNRNRQTRILNLPAMCGMNSHSRQATRSTSYVSLGLCIQEVIDGRNARNWDDKTVRWFDVRKNNDVQEFTEGDFYDQ